MDNLVTAVVAVIAALGGTGFMFRFLNGRIKDKVDKSSCNTNITAIKEVLAKGDKNFTKIMELQSDQKEALGRIDERVKALAAKNGIG